jgi:undecaprenyl-diphosphatase
MEVEYLQRLASWLTRYDGTLIAIVNRNFKCRLLDYLMPRITHLGGATATISFLVIWYLFAPVNLRVWAIQGMIALGSSHVVVQLLKFFLPRLRPYVQLHDLYTFPNPLTDYSFPSGHSTAVFSIAMIFMYHMPISAVIFLPIAILVAFSRMYLALHYPTDVLMGSGLGISFALLTIYLF